MNRAVVGLGDNRLGDRERQHRPVRDTAGYHVPGRCGDRVLSGSGRSLPPVTTPPPGVATLPADIAAAAVPAEASTDESMDGSTTAAPAAVALLARLDADHPVLAAGPARERLLAAAWLAGYRSARTRRAYALDLGAWLEWLQALQVDVLAARRVHVDLWVRQLLDTGAAASSVARRYDHARHTLDRNAAYTLTA